MPANADDLRTRLRLGCRDAIVRTADHFADQARDNAPVKTGHLRDSITDGELIEEDETHFTSRYTAQADYAEFVDQGTNPHVITATNAPLLTFYWEDGPHGPGIYRFKSVNHPGSPAQNFMLPAQQDFEDALREELFQEPFFREGAM